MFCALEKYSTLSNPEGRISGLLPRLCTCTNARLPLMRNFRFLAADKCIAKNTGGVC